MATDGWYPPAIDNKARNSGGTHLGPVTVGLLHTTESTRFYPNKDNYFGSSSYPHFTCIVVGGIFFSYQHISIREGARALKNLSGGVQTNREGVIQIEVVGTAVKPFTDDPVMVAGLRDLMRWIEEETEIEPQSSVDWVAYPQSYGQRAKQRLSFDQWRNYNGWLGHQHAPENDHGDPGAINIAALLPHGTKEGMIDMLLCKDPNSSKQYLLSGNTRKYIGKWEDLVEYERRGVPRVNLTKEELASYPEVTA